jgi:hypothetical protein
VKERASSIFKRTLKIKKKNIEEAKVKDCHNLNKDQVLVEIEEWSGKEKVMKQKGKLKERRKQRRYS